MVFGVPASSRGDKAGARKWIVATILLGLTFVVLHLFEWRHLIGEGLRPFYLPEHWVKAFTTTDGTPPSPLFGATFFAITGLHMFHVLTGALYLSVGSLLVAASVLPAWSVFPLAIANCALMLGIVSFLPHSAAFDAALRSNDAQQILAGPLLMQGIVAIVAYVWAQSMVNALQRADRAEEIAILEQRELKRQAELEEGVRQLLAVHVRLANGDFQARSSGLRNPLLWSVGNSLNILIARLSRSAQADAVLRREEEEVQRLANAIRVARSGRQLNLPEPRGVPLDIVVDALRSRPLTIGVALSDPRATQGSALQKGEPGPAERIVDPGYDLPEWLRSHS
jgi:hypothetical protein